MRTTYFFLFLFIAFIHSFAQSWDSVISNKEYVYGEGTGSTVADADRAAINDLLSKISLQVYGNTFMSEEETSTNEAIENKSSFKSIVNTYSFATLNNTEKVILKNEPDALVGRWIKRSDIARIFESRKLKIIDYINSAIRAEEERKIDFALKDLYWALSLVKTLQDPNEFLFTDDDGKKNVALSWIPRFMNEIFTNLKVSVIKRIDDNVELKFTYKDSPISSVDYTYFDGRDWSNIYSAKDGIGILELAPGCESSYFQLKFEYEYRGESHIDKEIETVLNAIDGLTMRNAYATVKAEDIGLQHPETATVNSSLSLSNEISAKPGNVDDYKKILDSIAQAVVNKRYDEICNHFTSEAKDIYTRLIKYGQARIVGTPQYSFYQYGNNVIARGMQMSFSFRYGLRKSFIEEVIFSFDSDNLINNISFGLGKIAEADILGKGVWSNNARVAIMSFLENYQTAYALKRLEYISSIFDDDAVIITGTVVKKASTHRASDNPGIGIPNDIIRYNRHNKDSYLRQLEKSFNSKEYINIRFANNEVRKLGKGGELYAIQLSQEYYSSNYGDKGYLFLMVDINDPESPIIKIRTWQPEKDPDFGIYGPEHFK